MAGQLDPAIGDVLNMLPWDVVHRNIWASLPPQDRLSLRQTSRELSRLTSGFIVGASHDLASRPNSGEEGGLNTTTTNRAAWRQAVATTSAFLGRLPRLSSLQLEHWAHERDLPATLRGYHPFLQDRLQSLTLRGGRVTCTATLAIRFCFPNLQELHLTGADIKLRGALFDPMHGATLSAVSLTDLALVSADVVRSLVGQVSHLTRLHLSAVSRRPRKLQALSLLASLPLLRHCSVECRPRRRTPTDALPLTLADFSALFALTLLTSLQLRQASSHPYVAGQHTPTHPPSLATVAALTLLGGMTRLCSLTLSSTFLVCDAAMAALGALTQLTALAAGSVRLTAAAAATRGRLPALQHLLLAHDPHPSHLLLALCPLYPLPSLTLLQSGPHPGFPVSVSVGGVPRAAGVVETPYELMRLAGFLSWRSLALRLSALRLCARGPDPQDLRQVAWGLTPLAGQLSRLCLSGWPDLEQGWMELGRALPGLRELTLEECTVRDEALPPLVYKLRALRRLCLERCTALVDPAHADSPPWSLLKSSVHFSWGSSLELCILP